MKTCAAAVAAAAASSSHAAACIRVYAEVYRQDADEE